MGLGGWGERGYVCWEVKKDSAVFALFCRCVHVLTLSVHGKYFRRKHINIFYDDRRVLHACIHFFGGRGVA